MIQAFVNTFEDNKDKLRAIFAEKHVESYESLVRLVVTLLSDTEDQGDKMNPDIIHVINDGDYQGTLLFVIPAETYQPHIYWYVKVYYGSCSGCDTLQAIHEYDLDIPPNDIQINDYMTLALHIVQGLKRME